MGNILTRRRELILPSGGGGGVLPSEYQQVEWIQPSAEGTAYLDLGIGISNNDVIKMRVFYAIGTDSTNRFFFGARTSATQNNVEFYKNTMGDVTLDYGSYQSNRKNFNRALLSVYGGVDVEISSSSLIIDNTVVASLSSVPSFLTPDIFLFFANGVASGTASAARIYSFSISGDHNINLVPCYRKSDSVVGMYDTISSTFFTNAGSGSFITSGGQETWDYEWDYTKGLLSSDGWSAVVSGSATETLMSDCVRLQSNNTNSYIFMRQFNMSSGLGVMEVVFSSKTYYSEGQNSRFCLSNGANGIQVICSDGYFCLFDNNKTAIAPFTEDTEYTMRLEIYGTYGRVYINGSLVSTAQISNILYAANTQLCSQNQNGGYTDIKSVKIKQNRIT